MWDCSILQPTQTTIEWMKWMRHTHRHSGTKNKRRKNRFMGCLSRTVNAFYVLNCAKIMFTTGTGTGTVAIRIRFTFGKCVWPIRISGLVEASRWKWLSLLFCVWILCGCWCVYRILLSHLRAHGHTQRSTVDSNKFQIKIWIKDNTISKS